MNRSRIKAGLVVITGSMFSEKTTEGIRILRKHKIAGRKIVIFSPDNDNRSGKGYIASSDKKGPKEKSISINTDKPEEMIEYLQKNPDIEIVVIDEVQFFSLKDVKKMNKIVKDIVYSGRRVYAIGLKADFKGEQFGCLKELMVWADDIKMYHAICDNCGDEDASITKRKTKDSKQVAVGGKGEYFPICRSCEIKETQRMFNLGK